MLGDKTVGDKIVGGKMLPIRNLAIINSSETDESVRVCQYKLTSSTTNLMIVEEEKNRQNDFLFSTSEIMIYFLSNMRNTVR